MTTLSAVDGTTFQSTQDNLVITYSANVLHIQYKTLSLKRFSGLDLFGFILFFIFAWALVFLKYSGKKVVGIEYTNDSLVLGLVLILLAFLFAIGIEKIIFSRNKNKRRFNFSQSISNAMNWIYLPLALGPIFPINNFFDNYVHPLFIFESLIMFTGSILSYSAFYMHTHSKADIIVTRKDDYFDIIAHKVHKPFNFIPNRFEFCYKTFTSLTRTLQFSIVPASKEAVRIKLELKGRRLINYQWVTLPEAIEYAKLHNKFLFSIVADEIVFGSNFGALIGTILTIEQIQEILNFISNYSPASVVKLENKKEQEFVGYAVSQEKKPGKLKKITLISLLVVILVPTYIIAIIIAVFMFIILLSAPQWYYKLITGLMFIGFVSILAVPFITLWYGKKRQKRQNLLINSLK